MTNNNVNILTIIYGGYWVPLLEYGFAKELYARVVYDRDIQKVKSNMLVTKDGEIIKDRQCLIDDARLRYKLIQRGEIVGS